MTTIRETLRRRTRSWTDNQPHHTLFRQPKYYFSLKSALLAGIILQRILIIIDDELQDQLTFDVAQLIGLPILFAFEVLLYYWAQKFQRLKNMTDLFFGGFQIILLEFIIALSVPMFSQVDNKLIYILQQEILMICFHTIMFINSFTIKSGLLSYICLTFIFRLSPTLPKLYYIGWGIMTISIIFTLFILFISKDPTYFRQQTKSDDNFSKLENIPHGLAILTRDKDVIFMNGVFKGILNIIDERDALQKIMKMKRFEAFSEESRQLLLKEIQVRMNPEATTPKQSQSQTQPQPNNGDKVIEINTFPTGGSFTKKMVGSETPAIYIKRPPQGLNNPWQKVNQVNNIDVLGTPPGTPENVIYFAGNNKAIVTDSNEASYRPVSPRKLSHLTSLQAQMEEKDSQFTVEYSINSIISSLLDDSPDKPRRRSRFSQVAKNVVNGLFLRRASQHAKTTNNNYNIFDLTNKKTQKVQAVNRNSKGELRILEITLTPMLSSQKEALFIYLTDVTSEVTARDLHETSQYKDKLLKFVSHEFRTPLNCLVISLNTLKPLVSKELYSNYLAPALNSTLMLLSLVNDILDYSQIQARKLKVAIAPCNLMVILNEVISMMEMQASAKNLKLKLEWDPKITRIYFTDGNRLKQILVNLMSNALKFTEDGSVTIRGTFISEKVCKVEVTDTGVGISKQHLDNLFKEFGKIQENVHMNPQGVGLGLVISKLLSHELGADNLGLQVRSEVGVGTTFYFLLGSKRQEEVGFENTDLNSSSDDQEPEVSAPKLSEPHSRKLFMQKKSGSSKGQLLMKAKTSNTKKEVVKKPQTKHLQPFTLDFNYVYMQGSLSPLTSLASPTPQNQNGYVYKSRKKENSKKKRCLSIGEPERIVQETNYSEHLKSIMRKLNRTCKCQKVLLVDDNAFNLTALKMLLKSFEIESVGVMNGEMAIQEVLDNEGHSYSCKNFAIIFMDIEMPHLNGFDTARKLRTMMVNKEITYMPIVGITGHNPQEKRVECLLSGMNDMVCKPVTSQIMQELICRWVIPDK